MLTVAGIFRRHGAAFDAAHRLQPEQGKVLRSVAQCRTAALGGHMQVCDACGTSVPLYNSCRNRHCPTCQSFAQMAWVEDRMETVLPVPAFHVVFTFPAPLRALVRRNERQIYTLLFHASSQTLKTLGQQRLGAHLGITSVLHTWRRDMLLHPHIHAIVTAGGLSLDERSWVRGDPEFLFPVHLMAAMFRGKFLAGLQRLRTQGQLTLPDEIVGDKAWRAFRRALYAKRWIVYAKRPLSGAEHIYRYLGRYTHRVAISSARLRSVSDREIVFRTRGDQTVALAPDEFLRRYLLHVLPPGFRKIRHYGLYGPGAVPKHRLALAHGLAPRPTQGPATSRPPWKEVAASLLASLRACPHCDDGRLIRVAAIGSSIPPLPDGIPRPTPPVLDSS